MFTALANRAATQEEATGPFVAAAPPDRDIDPVAWRSGRQDRTPYPAQVRITLPPGGSKGASLTGRTVRSRSQRYTHGPLTQQQLVALRRDCSSR